MEEKVIDIQELAQDSHNFNKGNEQGQQLMERSFKELGAGRSILLDRNGNIIAGNKSQQAAIAAGIKRVRVIETTGDELVAVKRTDVDIDSAEGRKMAYLDNLTTQVNLTWDQTELQAVQADVEGFDIADFGFDIEDLPQVTFPTGERQGEGEGKPQTEVKEDDFDPDAHYETKVKAGEVWQLGEHRLMCGDSTDADAVAKLMNGERADLFSLRHHTTWKSPTLQRRIFRQGKRQRQKAKMSLASTTQMTMTYQGSKCIRLAQMLRGADQHTSLLGPSSWHYRHVGRTQGKFADVAYMG